MLNWHSCQYLIIYKDLNLCRWTVNLADSLYHVLRKFDRKMFFWVEEHGSADAVFAIGTMEDIYIDTTLTTAPERFVISKIGEGDRKISQLGIHFHHSRT